MSNKAIFFIVAAMLIVAAAVIIFIFEGMNKQPVKLAPEQQSSQVKEQELPKKKTMSEHKNTLPEIISNSETAELEANLSFLLVPDGTTKIEKAAYANGKMGYKVNIRNDYPIQSAANTYVEKIIKEKVKGWKILFASYNETTGLIEAENSDYSCRIEINQVSTSLTEYNIQIISK